MATYSETFEANNRELETDEEHLAPSLTASTISGADFRLLPPLDPLPYTSHSEAALIDIGNIDSTSLQNLQETTRWDGNESEIIYPDRDQEGGWRCDEEQNSPPDATPPGYHFGSDDTFSGFVESVPDFTSDTASVSSFKSSSPLISKESSSLSAGEKQKKDNFILSALRSAKEKVDVLIWGDADQYLNVRRALALPVGLLLAAGLYYGIIRSLKLPVYLRDLLGAVVCANLGLGFVLSSQVRCIVCLLLPVFFAKKGRSYITTYAVAYLVAGPISNILGNSAEITRSLSCTAELVANHSKAKLKLQLQPIKEIAHDLQKEGFKMEDIVKEINKAFAPIRKEITGTREIKAKRAKTRKIDGSKGKRSDVIEKRYSRDKSKTDADKAEHKFEKKLDYRCEDIFTEGVLECRRKFKKAERDCMKKLWVLGYVLCLPLKLTFLCNIVKLVSRAAGMNCNSQRVVNPGLGETYVASDKTMKQFDKQFDVEMKYKMERSREGIDFIDAKQAVLAVRHEFKMKQRIVDFFLTVMHTTLTFTFIFLFMHSFKYHKKYASDFTFDNTYITPYFRRIDARRHEQGKRTLLPLKKMEARAIRDPTRMKMKGVEKRKLVKGVLKLLVHVVIALVIIFVDRLLYAVLDIIRRHSRIDYHQQGTHEIRVKVYGKGFLAKIIRNVLKHFNKKHSIDNVSTNFECLPNPTALPVRYLYIIFSIYALVVALMFLESYGLRLRRIIASYYYPKREKKRTLYLYNDLLKKRIGFLHHARRRIQELARKRQLSQSTSMAATLLQAFPRLCFIMKLFASKKKTCLICEDPVGKTYQSCPTPGCNFGYCAECWSDIGQREFGMLSSSSLQRGSRRLGNPMQNMELCYACMPREDFDDSTSDSRSDSDSDSDSD